MPEIASEALLRVEDTKPDAQGEGLPLSAETVRARRHIVATALDVRYRVDGLLLVDVLVIALEFRHLLFPLALYTSSRMPPQLLGLLSSQLGRVLLFKW